MYILGINAFHGDAAAALVKDGKLLAAVEEERFNRVKHCAGFPTQAIEYCLQTAGVKLDAVEHIGISRDPSKHLHKKVLFTASRMAKQMTVGSGKSSSRAITSSDIGVQKFDVSTSDGVSQGNGILKQLRDRLINAGRVRDVRQEFLRRFEVRDQQLTAEFHNIEHHRAHLASCFFVSPFERAALLSIDGFGDFISTMWGTGVENSYEVLGQVEFPHSTGIVYTATTQFLGFPHYGDEGKVMGLAPYGRPRFIDTFRDIIRTENEGKFRLNLDYFRHHAEGVDMSWDDGSPRIGRIYSSAFERAFGPARVSAEQLTDRERDIAASLQLRLEEVAFHILNHLHLKTGLTDLGLAGGVAYNSVMNGKILLNTAFRRVFVQPAAGDSGTAIGVCYDIYNRLLKNKRSEILEVAYTGPEFSPEQIRVEIERNGLEYRELTDSEVTSAAAHDIAEGLVVGWFQGRMEFGPRALGNRSILADPRRVEMKDVLNKRIKKRESFRPFAPSILEDRVGDYFEQTHPAPTMLMVYQVRSEKRLVVPAITHVDGSGRLQTVTMSGNPRYYELISAFNDLTGVPVILNTSFNENEPIVCTPRDAIECFQKTRMDVLYIENFSIRRS